MGVDSFEIHLLGPVRVVRAGRELAVGGRRQRGLLALLVLERGRPVSRERLADELWEGKPPAGFETTLRSYVSRLRGVLGESASLIGGGAAYSLEVRPDAVDSVRFERLLKEARDAVGRGAVMRAVERSRAALSLWRGEALADVADDGAGLLRLEAERLEELRLAALELRIGAELELGPAEGLVEELATLVRAHPYRERFWRLLMLALYRVDRQADALAAYQRARSVLVEELGLEPSEQLRELEQAILRQEVPPPRPPQLRHNLPSPATSFVGRAAELAERGDAAGRGPAGDADRGGWRREDTARTRDGVAAAARLRRRRLLVRPQRAQRAGARASRRRAGLRRSRAAGDQSAREPDRAATRGGGAAPAGQLRASTRRLRRARASAAARPARGCGSSRPVVSRSAPPARPTTRYRRSAAQRPLESPRGFVASDAVSLFLARARAARPRLVDRRCCARSGGPDLRRAGRAAARDRAGRGASEGVVVPGDRGAACRPVPLPRLVAAADARAPPDAARGDGLELPVCSPRRSSRCCRGSRSSAAASRSRRRPRSASTATAERALELVGRLVDASLVVPTQHDGVTRYRLLETVRQYARERIGEQNEQDRTERRLAQYVLGLVERTQSAQLSALQEWVAAFEPERGNLRAALTWSRDGGEPEWLLRLVSGVWRFWWVSGDLDEGSHVARDGARAGSRERSGAPRRGARGGRRARLGKGRPRAGARTRGGGAAALHRRRGSSRRAGGADRARPRRARARAVRSAHDRCSSAAGSSPSDTAPDRLSRSRTTTSPPSPTASATSSVRHACTGRRALSSSRTATPTASH